MLTVAHSVYRYPQPTEGWITTQIRHQDRWPQVIWTQHPLGEGPEGVPLVKVPGRGWLSLSEGLRHAYHPWRYHSLIQRHRPGVLLAHFGDEGCRLLPVARRYGIPLLTRFYGYDVSMLPRSGRWRDRFTRLFAGGAGFLVEGPAMGKSLEALGCPPERIHVVPLGLPVEEIPWRPRQDDGRSPVKVLMVASLREKKGHTFGLSALAAVAKQNPRLQVTIIGDGPLRGPLEGQVRASALAGRVSWLGNQPPSVVQQAMLEHHLFLHPSVTAGDGDTEGGAPVVILEAQATGLPVISSLHADIPFVTRPGVSALLAPERDIPALVTALTYLLDHPERWAAMGEAGRAHVMSQFHAGRLGERLANLVDDLAQITPSVRTPA